MSAEELLFDAIDKQRLQRWSSYGLIAVFSNAIDLVYWDNYRNIIKCQGRGCFALVLLFSWKISCVPQTRSKVRNSFIYQFLFVFCRILSESHCCCVLQLFDLFPHKFSSFLHFTIPARDCTHLVRIIQMREACRMRPYYVLPCQCCYCLIL